MQLGNLSDIYLPTEQGLGRLIDPNLSRFRSLGQIAPQYPGQIPVESLEEISPQPQMLSQLAEQMPPEQISPEPLLSRTNQITQDYEQQLEELNKQRRQQESIGWEKSGKPKELPYIEERGGSAGFKMLPFGIALSETPAKA